MIRLNRNEGSIFSIDHVDGIVLRFMGYAFKFGGSWYMTDPFDRHESFKKVNAIQSFALEAALKQLNEK